VTRIGASVKITRLRMLPTVECENCAELHPQATRRRCQVHAQQTGHTVRFIIEDVTRYEPQAGGQS